MVVIGAVKSVRYVMKMFQTKLYSRVVREWPAFIYVKSLEREINLACHMSIKKYTIKFNRKIIY